MTPTRLIRPVVAALVGALVFFAFAAEAAAPQVRTQAPGYYRMMLGDFEITALSDGVVDLKPKELLTQTTPARIDELLARSFDGEAVPTSVDFNSVR